MLSIDSFIGIPLPGQKWISMSYNFSFKEGTEIWPVLWFCRSLESRSPFTTQLTSIAHVMHASSIRPSLYSLLSNERKHKITRPGCNGSQTSTPQSTLQTSVNPLIFRYPHKKLSLKSTCYRILGSEHPRCQPPKCQHTNLYFNWNTIWIPPRFLFAYKPTPWIQWSYAIALLLRGFSYSNGGRYRRQCLQRGFGNARGLLLIVYKGFFFYLDGYGSLYWHA